MVEVEEDMAGEKKIYLFAFLAGLLLAAPAYPERQQLVPYRLDKPPIVDGKLSDPCWKKAQKISLSPLGNPDKGIPPSFVQAVYTDKAVYFGFTCIEPKTSKLRKGPPGPGDAFHLDSVELFLDTDFDMHDYLQICVSASGTYMVNFDASPMNGCPIGGKWDFKTHIASDRYTIEMKLPFSQFPTSKEKLTATWNVGFGRYQYIDLPHSRIAVWKGYLMAGLHHKPKTWGDLGPFDVNFSQVREQVSKKLGPGGWYYPSGLSPVYHPHFPKELDPSLEWIKRERLRIAWNWLTDVRPCNRNNPQRAKHSFQDVVKLMSSAGFNVIIPSAVSGPRDKQNPVNFRADMEGMIRVRLAGAKTMFAAGYLWNKNAKGEYRLAVDSEGKNIKNMICPLDPYPWRKSLVPSALDALSEAKTLGVPNLFFGVFFDIEPQAALHGNCFCSHCWQAYCHTHKGIKPDVPAANWGKWLVSHGKMEEYKRWQKQAVIEMIRVELKPVRNIAPALVFGFYPYHYQTSWLTEAVLQAVSTRRAPGIAMDDQTYWSGYSGKPGYIRRMREGTIRMLGYEPFYLPSIGYCAPERNPDGTPKYPRYTYARAGREDFLMVRTAAGNICWGGSRDPHKDLLLDQKPYYTQGFAKAHKLLFDEGLIDNDVPEPATGKLKKRLDKAMNKLITEKKLQY